MATQFVSGTCRSYKAGTRKVLHWLYENAVTCGYGAEQTEHDEEEDEQAPSQPQKRSKLKPKAKKGKGSKAEGSGKAKARKSRSNADSSPVFVGVKEYAVLAETIAGSKTKIKVPLWVTDMVREVISARKKSARWFSRQSGDSMSSDFEESNTGHQHFINVLEDVLSILLNLQEPNAIPTSKKEVNQSDPLEQITNIFAALEVEPDTEHTLTDPKPSTSRPKQATSDVIFEEERSIEETLWLIYCFFEDFNIAREHLKDLWTTYKVGRIDLSTAALATNTAFDLFQRAADELIEQLQSTLPAGFSGSFKDFIQIQGLIYHTTAEIRGIKVDQKRSLKDPYNFQLWDIADWTCLSVYIILKEFIPVIQPGKVPVCTPGFFGMLNLEEDVLYPDEKFTQDSVVLLERFIPEVMFLNVVDPQKHRMMKLPGEDELTSGIFKMTSTKKIPIWLVLATQVYLDIHYVLLEDMKRPHTELFVAAQRATAIIREFQAFSKDMYMASWPKSNDVVLEWHRIEMEQFVINDFLDPLRSDTCAAIDVNKGGNFVLLKRAPVLCGMMLFRINLNMQSFGLGVVNAWGAVPTILHLYNACWAEQALKDQWLDMEALILTHSPERIFVGDRPNSLQEYLKRWMLVMGHSASMFSSNRRRHEIVASKKGPRQMLVDSVLVDIYGQRFTRKMEVRGEDSSIAGFTLAAIEKLLGEAVAIQPIHEADPSDKIGVMERDLKTALPQWGPESGLLSNFEKSHRLTTIQFLAALESVMTKEAFAFNVNYFSLHMRCFRLLRTIRTEMNPSFIKYDGTFYMDAESEFPFLVGYIFRVVSENVEASEALLPRIRSESRKSKILIEAGRIFTRFIEREGCAEIEKVKEASHVFEGYEDEQDRDPPSVTLETLASTVRTFNELPRPQTVPTGPGANHWHFSARNIDPTLDPPDIVFLVSPGNILLHVAAPGKGTRILSLSSLSDQAVMVVSLLLESFTKGLLIEDQAHFAKFAPWTWSCNDGALATAVEGKLKALGVGEELCTVQRGSYAENALSDSVWAPMKDMIVAGFTESGSSD